MKIFSQKKIREYIRKKTSIYGRKKTSMYRKTSIFRKNVPYLEKTSIYGRKNILYMEILNTRLALKPFFIIFFKISRTPSLVSHIWKYLSYILYKKKIVAEFF